MVHIYIYIHTPPSIKTPLNEPIKWCFNISSLLLCAEDSFFLDFTEAYLGHDKGAHSHATCNQSCLGCCRGPGMYLGDDWLMRDYNLNHFKESFLKKQHISWKVSSRFFWGLKKRSLRKFHPKKRWYVRQVNSNAKLSAPRSLGKWSNSSNIFRTGWNTQLKKLSPSFLKRKGFTAFFKQVETDCTSFFVVSSIIPFDGHDQLGWGFFSWSCLAPNWEID